MPFRPDWADAVKERAAGVCERAGVEYVRGDDARDQRIVRAIWDELCVATHVLIDLTGLNPNVCLELGIAHTLGKNTLVTSQASCVDTLFPMLRKVRVTRYADPSELEREVAAFLATAPVVRRSSPEPQAGAGFEASVRAKIASAVEHEATTGALARHLRAAVTANGLTITDADLAGVVQKVRAYAEAVPTLLEAARAAALHAGLLPQLGPLFDAARAYFDEPNDLVPDALGLAGITDDAYLAITLILAASQRSFETKGAHLIQLPPALLAAHGEVRFLLGEAVAVRLEAYVGTTLFRLFPDLLTRLAQGALPLQPTAAQPFYASPSGPTPSEYADAMAKAVTGG
jgi:uncharacterized membrane protein YkvA (DUF1232 family)